MFVRHTEPEARAVGRCYGRLDVDLSEDGRRHARALGTALVGFGVQALYSSPLRRGRDTARLIGAQLELEPRVHAGLVEIDFGELEGRTYDEIAASEPALYRLWMERPTAVRFPGGESYAELRGRAADVLAEIRAEHVDSVVAVVAHGGVIRAMLAPALGLGDDELFAIPQDYGGVSIVDWSGESALVQVVNADLILTAR
jgi:ribonuclease H / adenosylcobalamin/alpha-ribazole phosphatase